MLLFLNQVPMFLIELMERFLPMRFNELLTVPILIQFGWLVHSSNWQIWPDQLIDSHLRHRAYLTIIHCFTDSGNELTVSDITEQFKRFYPLTSLYFAYRLRRSIHQTTEVGRFIAIISLMWRPDCVPELVFQIGTLW